MNCTQSLKVRAKRLFDGIQYHNDIIIEVSNGRIKSMQKGTLNCDVTLDGLVVPGFIDLQVNGGGSILFNAEPTLRSLQNIMSTHSRYGTTAMLPTVITDDIKVMKLAAEAVCKAIEQKVLGVEGIHYEGPHISKSRKGAHSEEFIRPISELEWEIFERKDIGQILVTLAPELVSRADIKRLVSLGVIVSIGHSNATFECAHEAVKSGATGVTHLYNAMSPISAREAGVTGCALLNDSVQCGLIVDGHHVSIASSKLALKVKPTGGIFLVTDAMPPVGTKLNEFSFFDRKVTSANGKLTSSTGELAGSVLDMATAVKNCVTFLNVPEDEALRMASLYPLNFLTKANLPVLPRAMLAPSNKANFVQLDADYTVKSTWIEGQCVFDSNLLNPLTKQKA
jgi:N-acetylglucosamine-6-phosphate deacetylase